MSYHTEKMIARLGFDLIEAEKLVSLTAARHNEAKQKCAVVEKAISEYKQQAVTEERIAGLGIRSTTVDLAKRTQEWCRQNQYLREGNRYIQDAYSKINHLVNHGGYPSYRTGVYSSRQIEMHVLGWCQTIMSYDPANKSLLLGNEIAFEIRRIRDEIENTGEAQCHA